MLRVEVEKRWTEIEVENNYEDSEISDYPAAVSVKKCSKFRILRFYADRVAKAFKYSTLLKFGISIY